MQSRLLDRLARFSTDVCRDAPDENVRLLHLPDGRRLAYAEYGERTAYPLIFSHSHGSSRLEAAFFHQQARQAGFRIIAVDRPGVGLSDFCSEGSHSRSAQDFLALADKLRLQHFGALAVGGGAAFSLALASMAPQRVSIVLGISSVLPAWSCNCQPLQSLLKGLLCLLLRAQMALRHLRCGHDPRRYLERLRDSLNFSDRRLFDNPRILAMLQRDARESLRQGSRGVAFDATIGLESSSHTSEELPVPIHLWYGTADSSSQLRDVERFAHQHPGVQIHRVANRGRYFYLRNVEDVFQRANVVLGRVQSSTRMANHSVVGKSAALAAVRAL
jgi:pimeloyl-ACP methyl ester carboxylesterase